MPARISHSLPRAEGTEKSPCSDSQRPSSSFQIHLLMACLLGPRPILPLCLNIKEGEESCTSGTLQDINHRNSWRLVHSISQTGWCSRPGSPFIPCTCSGFNSSTQATLNLHPGNFTSAWDNSIYTLLSPPLLCLFAHTTHLSFS